MGDFVFYCSLCCNATFDSKKSLIDHLSQISLNLGCPICVKKFSSIEDLVEHLKDDDCDVKSVNLEINDHDETNGKNNMGILKLNIGQKFCILKMKKYFEKINPK